MVHHSLNCRWVETASVVADSQKQLRTRRRHQPQRKTAPLDGVDIGERKTCLQVPTAKLSRVVVEHDHGFKQRHPARHLAPPEYLYQRAVLILPEIEQP